MVKNLLKKLAVLDIKFVPFEKYIDSLVIIASNIKKEDISEDVFDDFVLYCKGYREQIEKNPKVLLILWKKFKMDIRNNRSYLKN